MLQSVQHLLSIPVPIWVLGWLVTVLWFRDRETRRWIMRVAETVDKMDSDEDGLCRHDPVAFVTTDPAEAWRKLTEVLGKETRKKR